MSIDNRIGAGYCDPITVEVPLAILSAQRMNEGND
jgi:hypothetical protein